LSMGCKATSTWVQEPNGTHQVDIAFQKAVCVLYNCSLHEFQDLPKDLEHEPQDHLVAVCFFSEIAYTKGSCRGSYSILGEANHKQRATALNCTVTCMQRFKPVSAHEQPTQEGTRLLSRLSCRWKSALT